MPYQGASLIPLLARDPPLSCDQLEGLSIAERDDGRACHSAALLSYSGLEWWLALCRARPHFCFESPINANQFFPKGCEGRAAAPAPASGGKSHGFDEAVV